MATGDEARVVAEALTREAFHNVAFFGVTYAELANLTKGTAARYNARVSTVLGTPSFLGLVSAGLQGLVRQRARCGKRSASTRSAALLCPARRLR